MNPEDLDDEIEELDTDISEPEELEDIPSEDAELLDGQTEYDSMPSDEVGEIPEKQHFGEKEYRAQNGDRGYYAKRKEELDHKVTEAREEKGKKYKKDPKSSDGSNTVKKNRRDRVKDNYNLEKARLERAQNGLNNIKAKAYAVAHPEEMLKDKAKETGKKVAKETGKAVGKITKEAVKSTGRLVATGVQLLISNPPILIFLLIAGVLLIVLGLFFTSVEDEGEKLGYYDTSCDYNLTTVNLRTCYSNSTEEMNLEDYVIRVAYGESRERNYSEAAIKALMIIIKTNALAKGNYDSTGEKKITIDDCDVLYKDNSILDYFSSTLKKLRRYYSDIESFLYLSESYTDTIESLGSVDLLPFNDDIREKLVNTKLNGYEEILAELYPSSGGTTTTTTNTNKPFIFIGDSRTVGMDLAVNELNSSNTVAQGSMGYNWFVNTAIGRASSLMTSNSYNIVSWMGVNGLDSNASTGENNATQYFNKYKELAQGQWKNHTIYVVPIGPVMDARTYYVKTAAVNAFNNKIKELINSSGINNLKYVDISFSISYYDSEGLHYNSSDYQKIFNDIKSNINSSKTLSLNKVVYDMREYCSYFHFNTDCESGWWYPMGESGTFKKGDILTGTPALLDTGPDNWGWRSDPFTGVKAYHSGSDLWAELGMNVVASRSGTVIDVHDGVGDCGASCGSGYGNYVVIDHGDGYYTRYGHLKNGTVSQYVSKGMQVSQGQIIGLSGNSGRSTGPHLHFEIREGSQWGTSLNPFDYISTSDPRPTSHCTNEYTNDLAGVCQALKDQDLTDTAVAALLGNMYVESAGTFDAAINAPDSGNGHSWGIVMWYNGPSCSSNVCAASSGTCNGNAMKCYCQQNNMEWDTTACQVSYLIKQINDSQSNSGSWNWYEVVHSNAEVGSMAVTWCQRFERAVDCYPNKWSSLRASKAREYLPFVQNGCKE